MDELTLPTMKWNMRTDPVPTNSIRCYGSLRNAEQLSSESLDLMELIGFSFNTRSDLPHSQISMIESNNSVIGEDHTSFMLKHTSSQLLFRLNCMEGSANDLRPSSASSESTRGRSGIDEERAALKRGPTSGCAELGRETAKAVVA